MIKLRNGVLIPSLGLGTFKMTDETETKKVILDALEVGYRLIDTAQMYGNEEYIGQAIKESDIKREELFIVTKLMNHHTKENTRKLIEKSLQDLQTDYIDLLLIHWPNHDDNVNIQTWKVFEEFYKNGKAKAIGISNFSRYQMDQLIKKVEITPFVNQIEFHPALSQVQVQKYLVEHGIQLMGYAPLMRGVWVEDRYNTVLNEIANKYNVSIPQILIAWGLSKNAIIIPKTVNKERLISNYEAKNIKLSLEDIQTIDKLNTGRKLYSDPANNVYGEFVD